MGMNQRTGRATISMHLRAPQIWWAYLAVRSNPAIGRLIDRCDRLIIFDDPANVPASTPDKDHRVQYLMVFWDGLTDDGLCRAAIRSLGTEDIKFFVVGDYAAVANDAMDVESLYADGPLNFNANSVHFRWKTTALLLAVRLKALLMPVKNIVQRGTNTFEEIALLVGKKQVVFCGSSGMNPKSIDMFCRRYAVDTKLFANHPYFNQGPEPLLEGYRSYLRNEGLFLSDLYDGGRINAHFFVACMQLLGRGYLLERIRDARLRLYANRFSDGGFVDVYSTPFYLQHVFLDFGSVVGTGNYPRLVDLRYFEKTTVEMKLSKDLDVLLIAARSGSLEAMFEDEWNAKAPQLIELMN
jgi:hypothetical protein